MRSEQTENGDLEHWTPEEVAEAFYRNQIAIIDVRTPQEYMLERVPGALLMPMSEFEPDKLPEGRGKRLVFHCGSGARSEKVARRALEAGLAPVAHMEGGFAAWKKSGQAYIGTDLPTGAPKRVDGSSR
jgi:rhodanese-related sulfurtransferase